MLKGKLNVNLEALEGLFKPKTPPLIGTDISTSAVKMVEISEAGKGVFRVERYAVEPLPKESVVDGNINNLDAVSEALKADIADILGAPLVFLAVGLDEDRIHAPNEKVEIPLLLKGAESAAYLWEELGGLG